MDSGSRRNHEIVDIAKPKKGTGPRQSAKQNRKTLTQLMRFREETKHQKKAAVPKDGGAVQIKP